MVNKVIRIKVILQKMIFGVFIFSGLMHAQAGNKGTASGVIKSDPADSPLESVTVSLIRYPDSAAVTGAFSNSKGKFTIQDIPEGEYSLKFSMIGFKDSQTAKFKINSSQNSYGAGTILLKEISVSLREVTITSQKLLFNNAIDRKVYNVQQDIISKTGSVSDLLQNVPSVQVDVDGNVSLRGSSNVQILIDGKPSPLMANGSSDVLQQLPASSVEKIEVITNPSAKYKPDGTSGLINIVLKKDANAGFNGNVGANLGNSSRYNFNASGNYRRNGFNLYGSYSYRQDQRNSYSGEKREQLDPATNLSSYSHQDGRAFARPFSHFVSLGLDYKSDEVDMFGLTGSFRYRGYTSNDTTTYIFSDYKGNITSLYDRRRVDYDETPISSGTAYYQHNFGSDDHSLRFEIHATHLFDQEDNRFTNVFHIPSNEVSWDNRLINQYNDNAEFTIEYHNKIDSSSVIELGYDGTFNKDDFPYSGNYFDQIRQAFVADTEKTNHFVYRDNIHSLYGTYEKTLGSFGLLGGLRAEEAIVKSDLLSKNISVPVSYFRLYPTLHLSYKLNELNEILLNYSFRVNRPEGEDINPFPEYQNPRNIRAGNPNLKPEYIHSIEMGYQFQNDYVTIVPSLFYRRRINRFTLVTKALNDSTLLITHENLLSDNSGGLELVTTASLWNIFNINASLNAFYEEIDASNLGYNTRKGSVLWNGNLNCNINIVKGTMLQLNSNYQSTRLTPQGEILPGYVCNIGLRHDMFNDKLSLIAAISDVFNTLKRTTRLNTVYLVQDAVSRRDSRVIFLGLMYHFGSSSTKSKEKAFQYDE